MSLYRSFNKSKYITPPRRSISLNKSNSGEISLTHPITMEKINHHYSHDSHESDNSPGQDKRKESLSTSEPDELNKFGEHLELREEIGIIKDKDEELFDDELSPGTSLRESRDTSPRRRGKVERLPSHGLEISKADKPIFKEILIMRVMICLQP